MLLAEGLQPQEQWLESEGGLKIFTRHWRPAGSPKAALVICHGVNSHGGQYLRAAETFAGAGFSVTALDLRGRGRSEGERFHVADVADYVADVARTVELAKAHDPGLPVFLLGHSAGGVVSVTYALDHPGELAGLICESFAYHVFAPDFALTLLKGASHVVPDLPALKLPMKDFSRDPARVDELLADPYTQGEAQPVETVAALVRAGDRLKREFDRIVLPVLILHGTADKVTRPDGSQEFFDHAGSADKQLILYEDHAHDLLADLGKERVFADIVGWLEARLNAGALGEAPVAGAAGT
jgi:alpha-beta hydrolase superfamily lysophospholipase